MSGLTTRRRTAAVLAAALASVGTAALSPTAALAAGPAAPDPSHHQIAYASVDTSAGYSWNTNGIFLDDVEAGTTTVWLRPTAGTTGAALVSHPVLSPDATKIAYLEGYDNIRVIDLTTNVNYLVTAGDVPQWTPDSSALVFHRVSYASGYYTPTSQLCYVPAVPGGTAVALPNGAGATYPHVSPDGRKVSFEAASGLAVMNVDGSDRHALGVHGYPAAWSPDGSRLVYAERDPAAPSGSTRVAVVNANGTGHALLPSYPAGTTYDHTEDPVWSSDGTRILFSQAPTAESYDRDIFAIAPDGTGLTAVKSGPLVQTAPSTSGPEARPARVPAFPAKPAATADPTSAQVSWAAVEGATSYAVTLQPGGRTSTVTGTGTSFTGLSPGATYTASVAATNTVGTGLPSQPTTVSTPAVVPAAPKGVLATGHSTSAAVTWTAPDDGGSPLTGYTVTASPGGATATAGATTTSATLSGLTSGVSYAFTVTATNAVGPGPVSTASPAITVTLDTTPPAVIVRGLPLVLTTATSTVSYTATDTNAGVASYDARYRTATVSSGFGSYLSPAGLLNQSSTSASAAVPAGTTICWSVRARDQVGNVSAWTPDRCTTRVVDERSLTVKTAGWSQVISNAYLARTGTTAGATGAQLASASWGRGRVLVVVAQCATCGVLRVYAGSTYLGSLSTYAPTTRYQVVLSLPILSGGGPVRIVTASAKQVFLDGVALQRY